MFKCLLSLFVLLPLGLLAQTDSLGTVTDSLETVPFVAYWAVGDVYKFDVKKIDIRTKNGEETKNDTSSYIGVFEVIDSTETAYRIKWSFTGSSPLMGDFDPEMMAALNDAEVYEVIYTTDELGTFNEIENLKEIQRSVGKVVDALMADSFEEMTDSVKTILEPLLRNMGSPAFIESNLLSEIKLIHYPYGVEYVENDTITYEELLPAPFGGKGIKSVTSLFIDSLDVDDEYIHLKQYMNLDEIDAKEMLAGLFAQMGAKAKEMEEALEGSVYKVRNDNDYYYYYYPGIPIYIDYFREIEMNVKGDEGGRIMRTLIEWVE